jgi:hypothetical protein
MHQPNSLGGLDDGKDKKQKKEKKHKKEKAEKWEHHDMELNLEMEEPRVDETRSKHKDKKSKKDKSHSRGFEDEPSPPTPASVAVPAPSLAPASMGSVSDSRKPNKLVRPTSAGSVRSAVSNVLGLLDERDAGRNVGKEADQEQKSKKAKKDKKEKKVKKELSRQPSLDSLGEGSTHFLDLDGGASVMMGSHNRDFLDGGGSVMISDSMGGRSFGDLDGGSSVMMPDHKQRHSAKDQRSTKEKKSEDGGKKAHQQKESFSRDADGYDFHSNLEDSFEYDEIPDEVDQRARSSIVSTHEMPVMPNKPQTKQTLLRFLISLDPPILSAETATGNGKVITQARSLMKTLTQMRAARQRGDKVDARSFAERILIDDLCLPARHAGQVEVLLHRLATGGLPVYKVVSPSGAELLMDTEAPVSSMASARSAVPSGALVLARERRRKPDGWWIRLAAGGGWMRETFAVDEKKVAALCEPSKAEVQSWLRQASAHTAKSSIAASGRNQHSDFLVRNAEAVACQVGLGRAQSSSSKKATSSRSALPPELE